MDSLALNRMSPHGKALPAVLSFALVACSHHADGGFITAPVATKPFTWTDDVWYQPVPGWGSRVRLGLPVPLDSIVLGSAGGLGMYGAHEGGHVEGLDHIWIPTKPGTVINSWGEGTVTKIENIGGGELYISVDYGQGLVGKHMQAYTALVHVGQAVKEGDPIARGVSAEFMLIDNNRTDGERSGGFVGAFVSPYDYLRDDVRSALLARVTNEVVAPYFSRGVQSGNEQPWEPMFTNKMLFHADHRGTIAGEWILLNKGWSHPDPVYYDVMTVHDVTNAYGHFQHAEFEQYYQTPGSRADEDATWQPGDATGRVVMTMTHFGTWYGLYSVDESSGRARLTIEWQRGSYPAAITPNAAVYVERAPIYLGGDAQALGLIR